MPLLTWFAKPKFVGCHRRSRDPVTQTPSLMSPITGITVSFHKRVFEFSAPTQPSLQQWQVLGNLARQKRESKLAGARPCRR